MKKHRIVVADDNAPFLQKLVSLLERDYDVVATAADGKSALELVRHYNPDVVILDLNMPELNGIEVTRELSEHPPSPPVVICSVETDPEVVHAALQAGALAYVFKARIEETLILAVKSAIELFQNSQEEVSAAPRPSNQGAMTRTGWSLSGTYFETCNCDVACPCVLLSPPTDGECTVLLAWHVEKGNWGGIAVDGLNVAIAVQSPGHMMEAEWKVAIYIDDRATPAQHGVLARIFSGRAGGRLVRLAAHVGKLLSIRSVPIEYLADGKHRRLRIPETVEAEIEGFVNQGEDPVIIANYPFCRASVYPTGAAKSKRLLFSDYGCTWNIAEKNAFFSHFHYTS